MKHLLSLILCIAAALPSRGQQNDAYQQYINTYKRMAIEQMERYRVPASITLAQGLIESNAGRSRLATEANNHFGIKVGTGWTGPYIVQSDDRPNDRFRKYRNVSESYEDHSKFLQKQRYASLFDLDPRDYEGWAHGLKAAGYATNPKYASILIGVIEKYDLAQYDTQKAQHGHHGHADDKVAMNQYHFLLCNDIVYIRAREGDTYASLARNLGIKEKRLREYNEVDKNYPLAAGDMVFLAKKKKHVAKELRGGMHHVGEGESVYSIAQHYGVRYKEIYKWNRLLPSYHTSPGDLLLLK